MKRRLKLVTIEGKNQDDEDRYHTEITTLYHEYNDTLVRYLTLRLRSRQDAVEVAQEAYIRLIRRKNLDEIECVQSFLFRTATNISIDLQRKHGRQAKNMASSKIFFGNIDEITPERALNGRQELEQLQNVIKNLPEKCRKAFTLYKFKNMDHGEIARTMGLSVSSVRKYIARALALCIEKMALQKNK